MKFTLQGALVPLFAFGLLACSPENGADDSLPLDPEYGKPVLAPPPSEGKADSFDGSNGPLFSGLSARTEVWRITRRWYQTDAAAGPAWTANSNLTWDEKYAAWVASLPKTAASDGGSVTYTLVTPWGKTLPAPALECAETGLFLRALFASWYNLPFYLSAYHPTHGTLFFGHFGIVKSSGARVTGYPAFADTYADHTDRLSALTGAALEAQWPHDTALRARALTAQKDDANAFLGENAFAGAYFDEILLNKRVGHFLVLLLTHFGSIHLADARNLFNLKPEAVRPGDILLERWQRDGIGHTMVVKTVTPLGDGQLDVEIVFGSMPRIQGRWYEASRAKPYFTSAYCGGPGQNGAGDAYAALGGGIKRWRTPVVKNGRFYNIVPQRDRESFIDATNTAAIAARTGRFETLLGSLAPEQQREALLSQIAEARANLAARPASCTNRQRREEAFAQLYALNEAHFGVSRQETDRQYRTLSDYVFAELDYGRAKTCCWNSTTAAMHDIVMAYNEARQAEAEAAGQCVQPVVFKAENGGYDVFAEYAASIGRAADWRAWSEDEPCPQRTSTSDGEVQHGWTPFCDIADAILGGGTTPGEPPAGCGNITWDGVCQSNTVVWCQDGRLERYDCPQGSRCAWDDGRNYYWCL